MIHIRETVGCEIPKRYAKSSSRSPHHSLQSTRKNSLIGVSERGAPRDSTTQLLAFLPQYFKKLTDGPKCSKHITSIS